ncbi:histidine acid phosphatase family protein [Stylonychia lemnae]|uniref:Histidine acid phosphatase family protein n=1 Tax=Stylonychia lemnae TaxID=5949 RepID=A0A078AH22_STYLE|nr:histidine acid phosphatase family protein [Stylonychia lemnae]|eukprot:CDW80158.1 histidine acid phosphatase family protein [Stylonychia lemnae]
MNKSLIIATAAIVVCGIASAKEPSRVGQTTRLIIDLSGPGATTPKTLFGKTKTPTDEPKFPNQVTPLGQRQQFIVGQELRTRYYQDAGFLNYSYDISALWIQTTFDAQNIVSTQAHLHGIYPPYTNINTLNDWQQRNAVPPLDNVLNDQWTAWQAELGNLALLNGFNTFPINVMGADDDFILNLSVDNCPAYKKSINDNWAAFENSIQTNNKDFIGRLAQFAGQTTLDLKTALDFCQYIKWADLHNVVLSFDFTSDDVSKCDGLNTQQNNFFVTQDQALNFIASNQFLTQTHDHIKTELGKLDYKETHFYKLNAQKEEHAVSNDEKLRNNVDQKPNYFVMVASDVNVRLILSGLQGKTSADQSNLLKSDTHPASLLMLELVLDKTGKLMVEAQFNDADIQLGGCSAPGPCDAQTFLTYLEKQIALVADVSKACALPSQTVLIQ